MGSPINPVRFTPELGGFLVLVVTTGLGLLSTLVGAWPAGTNKPEQPVVATARRGTADRAYPGHATRYQDIQRILDEAVEEDDIGAHTAFWRGMTRDAFVAHRVFGCPIIHTENGRFVGPASPLVQILSGPIACPANRERPQMPVGFPPVPAETVQQISDWIDAQCPE